MIDQPPPRGTRISAWLDFLLPKIIGAMLIGSGIMLFFGWAQDYANWPPWGQRTAGGLLAAIGVLIVWRHFTRRKD